MKILQKITILYKRPAVATAFLFIGSFAAIGIYLLSNGRAASPYVSSEAEAGSLSGVATIQSDTLASGGKFIKFGSSSASGTYNIVANTIMGPKGQYKPYGFVAWCLSTSNWNSCTSASPNDSDKIKAAASYWHTNTVRLQVAYENLYGGSGGALNTSYVSQLDAEVNLANSLGMIAIVTQQTERFNSSLLPDANSVKFWNYMSAHYANSPKVFFDLFNEPRLNTTEFSGTEADEWNLWQNGGTVTLTAGGSATYVGMQTLVTDIRANHANNIIIAEGNHGDHDLSLLTTHLLNGTNVTYGIEPNLYGPSGFATFWLNNADETTAEWDYNWGNLSQTYPLMVEAFNDHPGGGCYPNSATVLPQLLSYLNAHGMGMVFFSLDPGVGVIGSTVQDLQTPTSFTVSPFNCSSASIIPTSTEGAGALVKAWFGVNSTPQ